MTLLAFLSVVGLLGMFLGLFSPKKAGFFLKNPRRLTVVPLYFFLFMFAGTLFAKLDDSGPLQQVAATSVAEKPSSQQEEAQKKREAWENYHADPVIKGRKTAESLESINGKYNGEIAPAVQEVVAFSRSGGRDLINSRTIGAAALAFDDMRKAYEDFSIPSALPDGVQGNLEASRILLHESALAGTEAFLELQRLVENKKGSLKLVTAKMAESTQLREAGAKKLTDIQITLFAMPAPARP
ncbi:hypothetical protein [Desulfovibrio cuneatus]|uniref:hypothetical protein n=1 Tax=Desulfovibrio cuneatus TaxID=159728 RepID=UPI0003FCA70F|nr:hypothetical protein [Desulfovibrio cuneatus]